ncbi:hypothetical protein [Streptomyces sudanensis]|uniref:hypothetical protein n=1 Tax=Streptomyces sudanensis TaxID=436397 RepID=UPI0020CC926F|nr:hypothetical protein [Streptomyces sudanensis]MCQ0002336.1 hypothetical protein [Streptomyces sudanensis]
MTELGPAGGGLVVGATLYAGYKTVRWVAGEWAYFATKARQIRGHRPADELAAFAVGGLPPGVRMPSDRVEYADDSRNGS